MNNDLIKSRLLKKRILAANGCWLHAGCKTPQHYARIWTGSRHVGAHRLAYEIWVGPILDKLHVCHKCDTPACFNPEHLFLGTMSANITDATLKGRNGAHRHPERLIRGAKHHKAKLDESGVRNICNLYLAGQGPKEIALAYGLRYSSIWAILSGFGWRHITNEFNLPPLLQRKEGRAFNSKYSTADIQSWAERYSAGESCYSIACSVMGKKSPVVAKLLKQAGIQVDATGRR